MKQTNKLFILNQRMIYQKSIRSHVMSHGKNTSVLLVTGILYSHSLKTYIILANYSKSSPVSSGIFVCLTFLCTQQQQTLGVQISFRIPVLLLFVGRSNNFAKSKV